MNPYIGAITVNGNIGVKPYRNPTYGHATYSNMAYFPGEHFLYFLLNILNIVNLKYLIRSFVQLNRWSNKNAGLVKKTVVYSQSFLKTIFFISLKDTIHPMPIVR